MSYEQGEKIISLLKWILVILAIQYIASALPSITSISSKIMGW